MNRIHISIKCCFLIGITSSTEAFIDLLTFKIGFKRATGKLYAILVSDGTMQMDNQFNLADRRKFCKLITKKRSETIITCTVIM